MAFFTPLSNDDVRSSLVVPRPKTLVGSSLPDEEQRQLRLDHNCRHDRDAGISIEPSLIVSNQDVSISLARVGVSPVGMSMELRLDVHGWPADAEGVSGTFPWAVTRSTGHWSEGMFYLADRPEDICRFGVRYGNGGQAATGTGFRQGWYAFGEDDLGSHDSSLLRMQTGGHDSGQDYSNVRLVFWPAPPDGDVVLFVEWPTLGIGETSLEIAASNLRAASGCSLPLE